MTVLDYGIANNIKIIRSCVLKWARILFIMKRVGSDGMASVSIKVRKCIQALKLLMEKYLSSPRNE